MARRRADAESQLTSIEKELDAVQSEHKAVEAEKVKAEKELKELMARFKLRKSLLHWRHRKLTLSFRALITIVFRERIERAKSIKASADESKRQMEEEMAAAVAARQKARERWRSTLVTAL